MKNLKVIILLVLLGSLLTSCSHLKPPLDTKDLVNLGNPGSDVIHDRRLGISLIRLQALKETALGLGARAGLSLRSKEINNVLRKHERNLDKIFNFNALLLNHNILPPVLEESRNNLNLAGADAIRITDRTYRIIYQARFVTAPPTWRTYLWLNYKYPELPDDTLLPKNKNEIKVWRFYVNVGWRKGIKLANRIYDENLSRLRRDYQGMVLYRKMLNQNMVTAPFVARTELGITGDSSNLRIDDQVLRITAMPIIQPNSQTWNPVVVK